MPVLFHTSPQRRDMAFRCAFIILRLSVITLVFSGKIKRQLTQIVIHTGIFLICVTF